MLSLRAVSVVMVGINVWYEEDDTVAGLVMLHDVADSGTPVTGFLGKVEEISTSAQGRHSEDQDQDQRCCRSPVFGSPQAIQSDDPAGSQEHQCRHAH